MNELLRFKRMVKAKIKLYYDNGNFDYKTVMNIIDNIYNITHPERKKK